MKREDSSSIDIISKKYKYIEKWKSVPLLLLGEDFLEKEKILKENPEHESFKKCVLEGIEFSPLDEFIFTTKTKKEDPRILFKFSIDKYNKKLKVSGSFFTNSKDGLVVKSTVDYSGEEVTSTITNEDSLKNTFFSKDIVSSNEDFNTVLSNLNDFVMNYYILVFYALYVLNKTDLHPVEKTVDNFKRKFKHTKKRIGKQRTIVYLNKLPVKYINSEPKGGHHASPCYHQRIGHMHTMRHEKFKDHPDYMKPIWRKPVWVGVKETIVDGVTYKVL